MNTETTYTNETYVFSVIFVKKIVSSVNKKSIEQIIRLGGSDKSKQLFQFSLVI